MRQYFSFKYLTNSKSAEELKEYPFLCKSLIKYCVICLPAISNLSILNLIKPVVLSHFTSSKDSFSLFKNVI